MSGTVPVELLVSHQSGRIGAYVRRIGADEAAVKATTWVRDEMSAVRALGILVLGQVALEDSEVLPTLLDVVRIDDESVEVRRAIADALGDQSVSDPCAALLLRLVDDEDEAVRTKAIGGLGVTLPDPIVTGHPAFAVFRRLLDDESPKIRDWTAFTLGRRDIDQPGIRDRLLTMAAEDLDNDEIYPAAEAAFALAHRRDDRVVPVIAERIGKDRVGMLWLRAAAQTSGIGNLRRHWSAAAPKFRPTSRAPRPQRAIRARCASMRASWRGVSPSRRSASVLAAFSRSALRPSIWRRTYLIHSFTLEPLSAFHTA